MMRTQFLNNFNKDKENRQAYKKQQFFYVKLSKTVNKKFYNNPDGKKITDIRHNWVKIWTKIY